MIKATWEERVWLPLPHHCSSLKEVRTETPAGQDPGGRADTEAMEGAAYWLAPYGLLSLLSYRTQEPGMAPPIVD